jgi:hypothetical protein
VSAAAFLRRKPTDRPLPAYTEIMGVLPAPEAADEHWERIVDALIDLRERLPDDDWQPQTVTADPALRTVATTPDHLHPSHSWALGPARATVYQAALDAELLHILIPALPDLIEAMQVAARHAGQSDRRLAGITRERLLAIADRIELLAAERPPEPTTAETTETTETTETAEMAADLRRWAARWAATTHPAPGAPPPPRGKTPRTAATNTATPAAQADALRHSQLQGRLEHLLQDVWTYPGCPAVNGQPIWSTTTGCIRTLVRRHYLLPVPGPGLDEPGAEVILSRHRPGPAS